MRAAFRWRTNMVFRIGLSNLPLEPPDNPSTLLTEQRDDPSALYSPADFVSIGMQRVGEPQIVPAQFRSLGRQVAPPGFYPGQGRGLAPGGGRVTEIPMPEWWKTWGPAVQEMLPSVLMARRLGKKIDCHKRYEDEEAECWKNKDDYAHPDFLDGCLKTAAERRSGCIANGGRPSSDERPKWRAGSDKNPGDEEIYKNPDR
jgi:hypothetical protein